MKSQNEVQKIFDSVFVLNELISVARHKETSRNVMKGKEMRSDDV